MSAVVKPTWTHHYAGHCPDLAAVIETTFKGSTVTPENAALRVPTASASCGCRVAYTHSEPERAA